MYDDPCNLCGATVPCACVFCAKCGRGYPAADAPGAPALVSEDDPLNRLDLGGTGACGKCWSFARKHGRFPGRR